ncbi:MAG: hypothetical protein H6707_18705 [Deltaproteobacteria bacterium]|nr:hypothetical protein [Deltaproteobacteria bacterium]
MTPWVVGIAAGVAGLLGAKVLRSSTAGMLLAAAAVALGAVLIAFNYADAQRAALGEARLEHAELENLNRRLVRCSRVTWHCELATQGEHAFLVPFDCGGPIRINAAFYKDRPNCASLPNEVAGYLLDRNEVGCGAANLVLQVGAKPRTFPSALAWIGAGFVMLGFVFPIIRRWAARRATAAEDDGDDTT